MENSKTQEKIINLGKQLVTELERTPETDFLCRWMAHYLAEQITLAESATCRKKAAVRKQCFDTILALWKHRASLPNGRRPFEKFEPVLHALRRLNPENPQPYYHRFKPADKEAISIESKLASQLIDMVFAVDSAARVLVDTALNELTKLATTKRTRAMLANAPKPATQDTLNVIRVLFENAEHLETDSDREDTVIRERLKKLQDFTGISKGLKHLLEKKLRKRDKKYI